jgi:hypothetical protein
MVLLLLLLLVVVVVWGVPRLVGRELLEAGIERHQHLVFMYIYKKTHKPMQCYYRFFCKNQISNQTSYVATYLVELRVCIVHSREGYYDRYRNLEAFQRCRLQLQADRITQSRLR